MFFSTIETHDRTKEEWHKFTMDKQGLMDLLQDPFSNENWPAIVRGLVKDTPAEEFFLLVVSIADLEGTNPNHRISKSG
jgi:hypothetical protein